MKKFISNKYILYTLGIILFFIIWWMISLIVNKPVSVFPDPIRTIKESFTVLQTTYFYKSLGMSLLKMLIGFIIALLIALLLGIPAGYNENIHKVLSPTMTILKAIPTAALVLLFLVLIGAKNAPIIIVVLISFPILYESIVGGITNVDKEVKEAASIETQNILQNIFLVRLPLAMPTILVGISSSFALSFKIEIMAEIVSGDTSYGLGTAIALKQTQNASNMVPVFAYAFLAIVLMLIVTALGSLVKKLLTK